MDPIFVRAKPKKISVKETYHYKASVGDNRDWQFDTTEAEIALEFLFDGHNDGFFGADAREDVRVQDPDGQAHEAQVGHLVIVKAGESAWKDKGFEGKAIPIKIDIEELQKKLESSQKLTVKYLYRPHEPKSTPVRLGRVELRDQDPIQGTPGEDFRAGFYPYLMLSIELIASSVSRALTEGKYLSEEEVTELYKEWQAEEKIQVMKFLPGNASSGQISQELLGLAETDLGGYLFIGIGPDADITGLNQEDESGLPLRLMEAALRFENPIPLQKPNILQVTGDDGDRRIGVVLVPPGLKDRYPPSDRRDEIGTDLQFSSNPDLIWIEPDTSISVSLIKGLVESGEEQKTVYVTGDVIPDDLAKAFVALANTQGGYLLFGVQERVRGRDNQIIGMNAEEDRDHWEKVRSAFGSIKPRLWRSCRQNYVSLKRRDGQNCLVHVFYVPENLKEVYSFQGQCWRREEQKNTQLEPEEVFELFRQRYQIVIQDAISIGEPPKVTFGNVQWPYTTLDSDITGGFLPGETVARKTESVYLPSKYDPACGALEWHEVWFGRKKSSSADKYEVELCQKVTDPEELRQTTGTGRLSVRDDLTGHFDISLGSALLSGLQIAYFDARGETLPEDILSRETIISLDVTFRVGELFVQNRLYPHRRLEFEGVYPEPARYEDVREVLQDLGLRIISADLWRVGAFPRHVILEAQGRLVEGRYVIGLRITNRWYPVTREINYGERTDTAEVPSGRMTVEIFGWADGPKDKDLTKLLNELQRQLKERFKYVRMS